jgi:transposase
LPFRVGYYGESGRFEVVMGYNFLPWDHDQQYLLPPDIREWLPADHEVWALLEAASLLDFSDFFARRRADGWGRAAYHPAMMALLLLYAYAQGERSSRKIERRCREDVALRVLCANQTPDHATIARFRAEHADELKRLHTQVLTLCATAGLGSLGLVALDSTKLSADASKKASKRYEAIVGELERMYAEAAATDAAEDAGGDDQPGWGRLPRDLAEAERRRQRFERAKATIDADVAAEQADFDAVQQRQQAREAQGHKRRGRPPKSPPTRPTPEGRRANVVDPDSRLLRRPGGFVQGYSAQLLASEDGIALAFDVNAQQNDHHQLHPMLDQAQANLAKAGLDPTAIKVLLADAGYYCDDNITTAQADDPELLIATIASSRIAAGKIEPGEVAHRSKVAREMTERLTSVEGRELYARRGCTIEPQFGDDKHNKGFTRFSRRGQAACQAEWALHNIAKNLQKWARRRTPASPTGSGDGDLDPKGSASVPASSRSARPRQASSRPWASCGGHHRRPARHLTGDRPYRPR